jgi:hypothetical protein
MKILFYLITAILLIIPFLWEIKHKKGFKLTTAGIIFICLIFISIGINIIIDLQNDQKDKNQEGTLGLLLVKTDSLTSVNHVQYDSLIKMQEKLRSLVNYSIILNDSAATIDKKRQRPLIKLTNASLTKTGSIELQFVNDGKLGATNFFGQYLFVNRSIESNRDTNIVKKPLPLTKSDIITVKDDYVSVNIPLGIFNANQYLDKNWIYLIINIKYSDITGENYYSYRTVSRLTKADNGKFSGCYNYEEEKYIKYLKK